MRPPLSSIVFLILVASGGLLAFLATPAFGETCSGSDGPVRCQVCPKGADANILAGLPRRDWKGKDRSSNLGDYHFFDCSDADADHACDSVTIHMDDINDPKHPDSVLYYFQSLAMYVSVGVLLALLTCFGAVIFSSCRVCCQCKFCGCCRRSCLCGCGKRWPTQKRLLLGFHDNGTPSTFGDASRPDSVYEYNACQVWFTRGLMVLFVLFTIIFILLGEFKGNRKMADAMTAVADSPQSAANVVLAARTPFVHLATGFLASVFVPAARSLNETFLTAVPLRQLRTPIACVIDHILAIPSPGQLTSDALEISGVVVELTALADDALPQLESLDNSLASLEPTITSGLALLNDLNSSSVQLTAAFNEMNTQITALLTFNDTILNPSSDLYLPGIVSNITTLTSPSSYPSAAELSSASTGTASLDALLSGATDGDPAQQLSLANKLDALASTLSDIPDGSLLLSRFTQLSTETSSAPLGSTISALDVVDAAVQGIPSLSSALSLTAQLTSILESLNLDTFITLVNELEAGTDQRDLIDRLSAQLDSIADVQNAVPCLVELAGVLDAIHEQLATIPEDFRTIDDVLDEVNVTLTDALKQVNNFRNELDNSQTELDKLTTSEFNDIRTVLTDLKDVFASATSEVASLNASIASIDGSSTSVDLSPIRSSLVSLNSSLQNSDLTPTTDVVDGVTALSGNTTNLESKTRQSKDEVLAYRSAQCIVTAGCSCTTPSDGCIISESTSTCCTHDLNKPLLQATLAAAQSFDGIRSAVTPDTSSLTTALNDVIAQAKAVPDTSAELDEVDAVLTSFSSVPFASLTAELEDMQTELDSTGRDDIASIRTDLVDVRSALNDVPSEATILADLKDVNSTIDDLLNIRLKQVNDVKWYQDRAIEVLYHDLPGFFRRLSKPQLDLAFATGGVEGLMRHVIGIGTDALAVFNRVQNETTITTNITHEAKEPLRVSNVLSSPSTLSNGPIYFFYKLFDEDTVDPPFDNGDMFRDAFDNKYPHDHVCVTSRCIRRSIDKLNTGTIDEASDGKVPLGISRQSLSTVLYLFPLLIALLGLAGAVGFCGKSWQYWPTCCATTCMCLALPLMFLLVGLTFPLVIFGGDLCRGYPNVGAQYVFGSSDYLCNDLGGTPTAGTCEFSVDVNLNDQTLAFSVDIPAVYSTVLGSCPPRQFSPLFEMFESVRDFVEDLPLNETTKAIDKRRGKTFSPRPAIENILVNGASAAGETASQFVTEMEEIWSCNAWNSVFDGVSDSMCCDLMTAAYWSMASWYLIAFSMCFCGVPAGIMGCKRFPRKLWGPEFQAVVKENLDPRPVRRTLKSNPLRATTTPATRPDPTASNPVHKNNNVTSVEMAARRAPTPSEVLEWSAPDDAQRKAFRPVPAR